MLKNIKSPKIPPVLKSLEAKIQDGRHENQYSQNWASAKISFGTAKEQKKLISVRVRKEIFF